MTVSSKRAEAAKLIGQLLATEEGRKFFRENGYVSGQAIVVAHHAELIRDVMDRIHQQHPPVTVAILMDREDDPLGLVTVTPSTKAEMQKAELASESSSIGMLYDAARQRRGKSTFRFGEWFAPASASSMPSASKLLAHA